MASVRVTQSGRRKFQAVRSPQTYRVAVRRGVRRYIAQRVKPTAPVRTGRYRADWRAQPIPTGVSLRNTVPYARYLPHYHYILSPAGEAEMVNDFINPEIVAEVRRRAR